MFGVVKSVVGNRRGERCRWIRWIPKRGWQAGGNSGLGISLFGAPGHKLDDVDITIASNCCCTRTALWVPLVAEHLIRMQHFCVHILLLN